MAEYVFDNPYVGAAAADFDVPTATSGQGFVQRAVTSELTVTSFTGTFAAGFTGQATRGELTVTGYNGGIVAGSSLNAVTGEVNVEGRYPGSEAKQNGLHYGATDADGDPISFEVTAGPIHGTLTVEFNGAILYSPNRGFSGVDGFAWRPWANGEPGAGVPVTLRVEPQRQALTGEVDIVGYAGSMGGTGLDSPADVGEVTVTGFASAGLVAGFVGTALLGELTTTGFSPNLQGALQAQTGEVTVTGYAGVTVAGWINQASIGTDLTVTGFNPSLVLGINLQGTLGEVEVTGFVPSNLDLPHGFEAQASTGELTVTGYVPTRLVAAIGQALMGEAGAVVGFVGRLSFDYQPPDVSRPLAFEPYYHPVNHLPAGRILDRATYDALMAYWIAANHRVLTDGEIYLIVGSPLSTPVIRRDWETGLYPVRKAS